MSMAQNLRRWLNFFMSEDEKKEVKPIFTEYCFQRASVV